MNRKFNLRNELKFFITDFQAHILEGRLEKLMRLDPHTPPEDGFYIIRSLYFDDYQDSCLHHNEFSLGKRRKYRIRTYGDSTDFFVLEKKAKENNLSRKTACVLTMEEFDALFRGTAGSLYWRSDKPLVRELALEIMHKRFTPKVVIRYERTAFIHFPGNVRVTLDRNISASYDIHRFTDNQDRPIPVLPTGKHLLEVKYDEFLPAYIKQMVQLNTLDQATFSKYYMGRITSQNHGGV